MSAFKHRRAQMEQPECEACASDQVVIDTKEGHMVCSDCGVIMRQSMISSNSEYRNFSETDKPTGDPTRVAAGPLGTSVMVPGNDNAAYGLKMKGMMLGSASDRFRAANKQIAHLVQKMGLPDEVKTSGQELYALYAQHREKIADMRATCAAAVLQGCRDCNIDRSLKEICKAASPEKEMKKQLSKAHRDLMKVLQQRQHAEAKRRGINVEDLAEFSKARAALGGDEDAEKHKLHAANMVPRFGSDLGLTSRGIQVAKKIATAIFSDDLAEAIEHRAWHGRQPLTLTAATLFIALHLGTRVMVPGLPPRTLQDVADICQVKKSTIEETYAELFPELRHLVPASVRPPMADADWAAFPTPDLKATRKR